MKTAGEILDALGGNAEVARFCGCWDSAVSTWRTQGIPSLRWKQLAEMAVENGVGEITLDTLAASQPSPPVRKGKRAA